jgi:hypothetical protein
MKTMDLHELSAESNGPMYYFHMKMRLLFHICILLNFFYITNRIFQ